jgi:hypothetical protein
MALLVSKGANLSGETASAMSRRKVFVPRSKEATGDISGNRADKKGVVNEFSMRRKKWLQVPV